MKSRHIERVPSSAVFPNANQKRAHSATGAKVSATIKIKTTLIGRKHERQHQSDDWIGARREPNSGEQFSAERMTPRQTNAKNRRLDQNCQQVAERQEAPEFVWGHVR